MSCADIATLARYQPRRWLIRLRRYYIMASPVLLALIEHAIVTLTAAAHSCAPLLILILMPPPLILRDGLKQLARRSQRRATRGALHRAGGSAAATRH